MKRTSPGRPRLDDNDETVRVSVSMPAYQYDYLAQQAIRQALSVPEVIRRQLPRDKRIKK